MSAYEGGAGSVAQSEYMKRWWSDPANKEANLRARLEARAQRLGVTVEALERPRLWAPAAERRRVYRELFRQGKDIGQIWKLYPNEDYNLLHRLHTQEVLRRDEELRSLL